MEFTKEELQLLFNLLKTELAEVDYSIENSEDEADKKELTDYSNAVTNIFNKVKNSLN